MGDPEVIRRAAVRLGHDVEVLERIKAVLDRQSATLEHEWKGLAARAWQVAVVHGQIDDARANPEVLTRYTEAEAGSGAYPVLAARCAQAAEDVDLAKGQMAPLVEARREADRRLELALDEAGAPPPDISASARATVAALRSAEPSATAQEFLTGLKGLSPVEVKRAWDRLTAADQQWLMTYRPFRIGNLDGVPAWVRHIANRSEVNRYKAKLDAAWASTRVDYPGMTDRDLQWAVWRRAGLSEEEARSVANLHRELTMRPEAQLLVFDMKHEGATRAAISIGDLDNASHVAVFVPGIGSRIGISGNLKKYLDQMDDLREETGSILTDARQGDDNNVAGVYWLNYSPPSGLEGGPSVGTALDKTRAIGGGESLTGFADGVRAINPGSSRSLLAHSYGSVTSAYALMKTDSFGSFVAFGSPGMPVAARMLQVPEDDCYYGYAFKDFVAISRWHGSTPGEIGFDRLPTGKVDGYDNSTGHSEYLKNGSSFQRSLAAVIAGHPEEIPGR